MTDRTYRTILGALLLAALYLEIPFILYGVITIMVAEGLTGFRIPMLVNKVRLGGMNPAAAEDCSKCRFSFEAERAWRLLVGFILLFTYVLFYNMLWFFPWFMGFAILGAGISGICPMAFIFKRLGFR
jgi:hypothetical protein